MTRGVLTVVRRSRFLVFVAAFAAGCATALKSGFESPPTAAAIAIRDDVSDFQKWGTRAFTRPFLGAGYAAAWYFVEDREREPAGKHRAFVGALKRALASHDAVDIFLLAHSNHYIDWVSEIDPAMRARIRLVYNTGCGDAEQGDRWLELGAKAYVGHPGDNIAPIFYFYFLPTWVAGSPLSDAVAAANRETKSQIFAGPAGWVLALLSQDAGRYWKGTEARIFGDGTIALW